MSLDRDHLRIVLIGEAAADIQRRLREMDFEAFLSDRDEVALTAFRLSIIGENSNKLTVELKNRHSNLPWLDMIAFRNIVAHEYHRVDPVYVWEAVLSLGAVEAMVAAELSWRENRGN